MMLDKLLSWSFFCLTHPLYVLSAIVPFLLGVAYWMTKRKYPVLPNGIILVTGTSTGIGLHTVEYLARKYPYVVYGTVRRDEDAKRLEDLHLKNIRILHLDICQEESCQDLIRRIQAHMEEEKLPFVGIVHNAAIATLFPLEFHPMESARQIFETNFFGVIRLTQLALPLLRQSHGRIVFISSMISSFVTLSASIYGASKMALDGLADALRQEVSQFDISVSIVKPGLVFSEMNKKNVSQMGESRTEEMQSLYTDLFSDKHAKKLHKIVGKSDSPLTVSKAVGHALTDEEPKTRYYVANVNGIHSQVVEWVLWLFNDPLKDKLAEIVLL